MSTSTTKPAIDNLSDWTTSCPSEATKRREYRNNWIAFIIIIVFSLIALCFSLLIMFVSQKGNVITHLEAKLYNVKFHRSMKNRTSEEFRKVSQEFCHEINKYFQSSQLSKMYRNCIVDTLRRGEKSNTTIEFRILFKNSETFVHPNQIRDVILTKAGRHKRNNNYYLRIGRFLVLYKSLRIFLVRTSSTVPDILVRSKENGVDPEPKSVENDAADDASVTTWTDETRLSVTSENYTSALSTTEAQSTNSVMLQATSSESTNIPAPSKGSTYVNSTMSKGSNFSRGRSSAIVDGSRRANNLTFSDNTKSSINSSIQIRNSSVAVKYDHNSDNHRSLNTGRESTVSYQLETPTISRILLSGGNVLESKLILAGTSPLSSTSSFMTKLSTDKNDNERNVKNYKRNSDEAIMKHVEKILSPGPHKAILSTNFTDSPNETFALFTRKAAYQNKTEIINASVDIYNQTSDCDRNESLANNTERLCAMISHNKSEDDLTMSSTESWGKYNSTGAELERLWYIKRLSRNSQQQANNSQFNISFSNKNITLEREVNENRIDDNTDVSIEYDDEESASVNGQMREIQNDTTDSINYDIEVNISETSINLEVNDSTVSQLNGKSILSSINSTTVYNTSKNSPSNVYIKHNASSNSNGNISSIYSVIREGSKTVEHYDGNLAHYYNSSFSLPDNIYIQNPRRYNDSRIIETTTNMKHYSSYTDKSGNNIHRDSLSVNITSEHYNKTLAESFNTDSVANKNESVNVFSMKNNGTMLNFEEAGHYNGTSSGAVVSKQSNRISNDSRRAVYFNNTQKRIATIGSHNDKLLSFDRIEPNNHTVSSFTETGSMLSDLDLTGNFSNTTAGNENRNLDNISSRHGNKEFNYQTIFSATTITTTTTTTTTAVAASATTTTLTTATRYAGAVSDFEDSETYNGSITSAKRWGRKDRFFIRERKVYNNNLTGTDNIERFGNTVLMHNQTLNSGYRGRESFSQDKVHNSDSLYYTKNTGHYNETLFKNTGSKVSNSTLSRVTNIHNITVRNNNNTKNLRNLSYIGENRSQRLFLSVFSLDNGQINQSVGHRERLFLNMRPSRNLTIFTTTSTVNINDSISDSSLLTPQTQTVTPPTSEFKASETLKRWTNNMFSNAGNDNLTFPRREPLILRNRSYVFFDSLRVKADSDVSLFHPGTALKTSNESEDLKYASVERNRTQVVSTTTVSPISAAVTERIDQIFSNRTTTTPKRSRTLIEFTKSKSRVNIKPSRSGWLAVRVDHSSRYFGRARKRKGSAKMDLTPTTTSSEAIGLVASEQRVDATNLNTKNRTQNESSTVGLLKEAVRNTNDSERETVVTSGNSDIKAIIADVTDIPQFLWYKPTTGPRSRRLQLGTELESISSNSRSINPSNNHAKSVHVFEEDTQLEKADVRKETSSIDNERKEGKERGFIDFRPKTTSSYEINDTNIIEGSEEVLTNMRRPFVAVLRQNVSLTENNTQLNSAQEALSNITDTLIDFSIDINNQSMMAGSADFSVNDTLISLGNDQLIYNSLDYTDYPETTNLLEADVSPTPVTRPSEKTTAFDITSYEHANDSGASHKSTDILFKLITNASSDSHTKKLKNGIGVTDSMLSPVSIKTPENPPKNANVSLSEVERKYTNTVLPFTETTEDKINNRRPTNTIDNVEISGDIISATEDPLTEAYHLTSNNYHRNDSGQSENEALGKQQTFVVSLTDESQNLPNVATTKSFNSSLSRQTTTSKNLKLNINTDDYITSASGKPKTNYTNTSSVHETTTAASVSKTTTLLRLFLLEGKPFANSSLNTHASTEDVLNRSSGVSSKMAALTSSKKLAGNRTKDSFGVTVIINIKSAGSGWVKIPINKTSPSKGVEIDVHRTSTTSTASKPFTNTSTANALLEPSLDPEATLMSIDIPRWQSVTPALNIYPVTSENPDTIKRMLIPTPASQTALTNASLTASKGLHLVNSYFQASDAPAFNAPTSVTGTKQNGTSTEEDTSTMKKDSTSTVNTESTSKLQTGWPVTESTTELGEKETVNRTTYGLSTKQATKSLAAGTTIKATTLLSTSATFFTPLITTIPTSVTMSSLPLTTTFPTTTTLSSTTLLSTTTSETTLPPTTTLPSTTRQTTLPSTTYPSTTTTQTTLPSTTYPSTTTQTTLPSTTYPSTTTIQTTLPSTTLPSITTQTTLPSTTFPATTTSATTLPSTTTLPLTTTTSSTTSTTSPSTMSTLQFKTMTTMPPTTNVKLTTTPPLTTSSSSSSSSRTFSFSTTLPLTTITTTTLPTTTTSQLTSPLLTTTIPPPPPATSTLPPTTIASTTSATTVPSTTSKKTSTLLITRPLTTQISTFSPTSSSTTATPPTQTIAKSSTTMTPSQTAIPITSTAIKRLPANTPLTSRSTIITAQTTSSTVTFAPVASSSPVDPTHTTPALTTTTTNPTTTEITVLNLTSVSGALYEPASIICTLIGPKLWTRIDLLLDQPTMNRNKILATFKRTTMSSETEDHSHSSSLSIRGQVSRAKLIIERFQCDDQGRYACRVDNDQMEEKINVYAKILTPDLPKIEVNDFVEHRTTKVSCTGIVPFPNGNLDWKLNGRILRRNTKMKVDTTVGNCTKLLTKTFVGKFSRRLNGSVLTCFERGSPQRFSSIKIQIVPSNFCVGRPINKVYSHPYTCSKYITCLDGYFLTSHCPDTLCYNVERDRCEKVNKPPDLTSGKDEFSCYGKPTGHAVPNPDECTGYYLCVAGLKNIRKCPSDTFFTLTITGFCTFDFKQSYCASIGKKLPNR